MPFVSSPAVKGQDVELTFSFDALKGSIVVTGRRDGKAPHVPLADFNDVWLNDLVMTEVRKAYDPDEAGWR